MKYQLRKGNKFCKMEAITYYKNKKEADTYIEWVEKTFPNEFWFELTKVPNDYPYYK